MLIVVLIKGTSRLAPEPIAASNAPTVTPPPTAAPTVSTTVDTAIPALGSDKCWVTLDLATPGAQVYLAKITSAGVEIHKSLDGLSNGPIRLEVPSEGWRIVANAPGFNDFDELLAFDAGTSTVMHIKLTAIAKAQSPIPAKAEPSRSPSNEPGTLSMNSIPVSRVLLDGKPLGHTPKVGVSVTPGNHVVTFIGPDGTRKTVPVTVGPGESKTAAARL